MSDEPEFIMAADHLKALQTAPDKKFMTPHGDYVWLKEYWLDGKRLGTTDCCPVSDPCERHASLTHEAPAAKQ